MSGTNADYRTAMCPHCGEDVPIKRGLTIEHSVFVGNPLDPWAWCPGSRQNPRCAESDARPLWNGKPNPRFGVSANDGRPAL